MNHGTAAHPDSESVFAPPASWIPMTYPRRNGFAADVDPVDPAAGALLTHSIETNEEYLQWAAWDLVDDPDPNTFALAARRYQAGEVTALGAAALSVLLTRFMKPENGRVVVDGWVARYGLPFAVEALLHASDLRQVRTRVPRPKNSPYGTLSIETGSFGWHPQPVDAHAPHYMVRELLGQVDNPDEQVVYTPRAHMLDRLRALVSNSSDDEYAAARAVATTLRTNTTRRLTATYLFPTAQQWSHELIMGLETIPYHWRTHLLVSANTMHELERITGGHGHRLWLDDDPILAAVVDGVGSSITTALSTSFDTAFPYRSVQDDAIRLRILHALSSIPTDDAFTALLERAYVKNALPAVSNAMRHYPRRAMRLLAHSDTGLFDRHVREHPDLANEMADTLPPLARRRIEELTTPVPVATDLPAILVNPPWKDTKRPATPTVIDGLVAPDIRRIAWLPGELEEIRNTPHAYSYTTWEHYRQYLRSTTAQDVDEWQAWIIFLLAPDEVARPLLTDWETTTIREPLRIVARYELDALPLLLRVARAHPGAAAPYLMPYVDIDVARLHATMFATRKNLRKQALAWFVRHSTDAAALLLPDAVGPAGKQRDHATAALRALARATTRATVVEAAEQYGSKTANVVADLLDLDPLEMLPKRIPKTPAWADLDSLPAVLTFDRSSALPPSAVSIILTMCAIGTADHPYAGLDTVTIFCDPTSLATVVWELFDRWWGAGAPSKDNWVILALGWLGDDTTVARLAPLIRRWPGEGGTARAQLGLDALAAHGSARALTELDRISRKMKFKSLKNGAAERVADVAERLGLDPEQLADRTVPDLDLTPDGTMPFDFGSRTFTVGFTEALVPYVLDESGKRSTTLPKATAQDDPALVEEAKKRFTALKREAKIVAAEQIKRFNRSLVTGRRWDSSEFTEFVLGHPLVAHVARRLLWASFDENSHPHAVFRVMDDNTFADIDGNAVALPAGAIGLVHPAHIPDTTRAWSEVFDTHGISQPFPQLSRPVHHPLPGDLDGRGLSRFAGTTASPSQALRLTYRGWEPVWENPASWGQGLMYRLNNTVSVLLGLEPGMGVGSPYDGYPDQKLVSVDLRGGTLADVDNATVSELLADLAGFGS